MSDDQKKVALEKKETAIPILIEELKSWSKDRDRLLGTVDYFGFHPVEIASKC